MTKIVQHIILESVILGISVIFFWLLERTTPARIGCIVFVILVSIYSFLNKRPDVLLTCALFFSLFDINRYLFDQILPAWIGSAVITVLFLILWFILFGSNGFILAIAIALIGVELHIVLQYIHIEEKIQSLLTILPFAIGCQYYYFGVNDSNIGWVGKNILSPLEKKSI